ncbi:host specificity protein J [Achromobacter sp. AGC39]
MPILEHIEDIIGAGGGGKSGGGKARVAVEDPDSAQSEQKVAILDLVSEGVLGGLVNGAQSIFLDDTALQNADGSYNFEGVVWDFRPGTLDQTPIPGFSDIESPTSVNVQVKTTSPAVISINNPLCDTVRMIMAFPQMTTQDKKNGDMHGASVAYHFEVAVNGGPYQQLGASISKSFKARSRTQFEHLLRLPRNAINGQAASYWTIRTVRETPDSTETATQNETWLDAFVEIVESRMCYPGSAYFALRLASKYFSSIPTRSYLVRGQYIRVPSNYDPVSRTYVGNWNGTFKMAISGCPAWVLFDVLTDKRYGIGNYIDEDQVDIAELYTIGRYCDELVSDGFGGTEPRFSINTMIQTQAQAFQVIKDICSVFRGNPFWNGSEIGFMQDRPGSPVMVFSQANIVEGSLSRSGTERDDRHSAVRVKYNDRTQRFKQNTEIIEDQELIEKLNGYRVLDLTAFGCASRGQAARMGRWALYTEHYENQIWQFDTGMEAATLLPGDIIKLHDTTIAGSRMSGRVRSFTATSVELDAPVTLLGPGASISIRMPDGTYAERYISESMGEHTTVSWASPLTADPVPNAIWIIAQPDLQPILARVLNVAQGDKPTELRLRVLEHNPSKFDAVEKGLKLDKPKNSLIDTNTVNPVTDFKVYETPVVVAPGVLGISLDMSWASGAQFFEVTWRRLGTYATNWETVTLSSPMLTLPNVRAGQHQIRIIAQNTFGKRSSMFEAFYTTVGRTSAPGDVANFKVQKRTNDLVLTWDAVTDIAVSGYEVRVGPSWDTSDVIIAEFQGTMVQHDQDKAGTYYYHIRSINADGVFSDNVSTFELVLAAPAPVENFDVIQSSLRLELRWNANPEVDISHYEIREGETWATGIMLAEVKATSHSIPSGTIGNRTFWIKAVASPGIPSELATFVSTNIAMPTDSNIVFTTEESLLDWPGYKLNMKQVGYDLMMVDGATRGEYMFSVDLLDTYRAQNSIFASLNSVVADTDLMTWETSLFAWDDPEAIRGWAPGGDIESVTGRYQIARRVGLANNEVDGWRLNDTLASVAGRLPYRSENASYDQARFANGLRVRDKVKVGWKGAAVDGSFSYTLTVKPKVVGKSNEREIAKLSHQTSSRFLALGYSEAAKEFYVTDHTNRRVAARLAIEVGDVIVISIVQTLTDRRLFVGKIGGATAAGSEDFAPLGAFNQLDLFW